MHTYVYIYIYTHTYIHNIHIYIYIYIYVYIYIERERERERDCLFVGVIVFCSQLSTCSDPHVDRCSDPLPGDPLSFP